MKYKLSDICTYRKSKVDVKGLNAETYISTENMLPNKDGITKAASLPSVSLTQEYKKGDILVSNIRPYFKKIWRAKYDGGCSNDVLVFQANESIDKGFLYYVLANDDFFAYSMATSKGTKMPRGDKFSIMQYEVPNFDLKTQHKIASVLTSLDDKIALNTAINENLEQQAQAIFKAWFGSQIDNLNQELCVPLGSLVSTIDNRGKTPPLSTERNNFPIIDVKALSGCGRIIDYNNCTKFVTEETYNNWFRNGHPNKYDILISTVGSLAEMKLFLGNIGCIAQNVVGFRANSDVLPFYLYQYLNYIRDKLITYNIGSVQPSIKVTHIIKHPIFIATEEKMYEFNTIAKKYTDTIYNNCCENQRLSALRDTLLPKLMNGEIDVSKVKI